MVIEAFMKRAKAKASKASKAHMQEEVDQPASYDDYRSEFIPQTSLIPKRPWLMPVLPIILPLTNYAIPPSNITAESDADEQLPDVVSSESDEFPSDHNFPVSDGASDSEISFPVSDDHRSDVMDVARSDEHDTPMSVTGSESGSDMVFPESPVATLTIGASELMVGIERDPTTGRFTAALFANFPDELLD